VEIKAEITIRASSSFSNSSSEFDILIPMFVKRMFNGKKFLYSKLFTYFFAELQSEALKLRLFSIKTRDRNSWLTNVKGQIQKLSPTTSDIANTTLVTPLPTIGPSTTSD
jgi:hypothetical protein